MAEAGLVLATFGAFNNAIQCFNYVHLAKTFDRDTQTTQLKLDVAKLRLSRWGRSVGLDEVNETRPSLPPGLSSSANELERAKKLLEHIYRLFEDAETQSRKLLANDDRVMTGSGTPSTELVQPTASLHDKLNKLSLRNFKPKHAWARAKWALHSEQHVRKLIVDVTEAVKDLVELFPAGQTVQEQLIEEEGRELASDENVARLQPLLAEQDPELNAAVKTSRELVSQVYNTDFTNSTNYGGLQQGHNSGHQTNTFGYRPN
ncbi:MAG: hypothetical protein Q9160_001450 [Pyrenula sp. 1 TL-2023]